MKKTPKIKTEKQCINCGKNARSLYKNINYKCDQCGSMLGEQKPGEKIMKHIRSQCKNCGKNATSVYKNIHYKCDQCGCFFILDQISMEPRWYVLCVMQTQNTYIELRSGATGDGGNFVGPCSGVNYGTRSTAGGLFTEPFKLLSNKFLMPAELREKEKLLRCFQ